MKLKRNSDGSWSAQGFRYGRQLAAEGDTLSQAMVAYAELTHEAFKEQQRRVS